MVLEHLAPLVPEKRTLRILITSGTKQGIDILMKGAKASSRSTNFEIAVAYFPLDAPHLMRKAFTQFAPQLSILVETELWPGFLVTARQHNVPVLLINGRMSEKSFRSYRFFRRFFSSYGPEKIYAISDLDSERFAAVLGAEKVTRINNIKFDRIIPGRGVATESPIANFLPVNAPFILLGSIRREEDDKILFIVKELVSTRPDCIIGLFPKHIERADLWVERLTKQGISATRDCHHLGCFW
jgi:3-deoxy-D-manno-octulosonic-acid transferase